MKLFITLTTIITTCSFALAAEPAFVHGVASGAPMADSIVLWTRVTPADANPVSVSWELSTSSSFTST